jgi:hypothetical protein
MASENTNPQVESHLTKLAEVCRESLRGGGEPDSRIVDQLLKSLLMSGFARMDRPPLQHELEQRMKDGADDKALHHAEEVLGITRAIQKKYDAIKLWESTHPSDDKKNDTKAANYSAATDS